MPDLIHIKAAISESQSWGHYYFNSYEIKRFEIGWLTKFWFDLGDGTMSGDILSVVIDRHYLINSLGDNKNYLGDFGREPACTSRKAFPSDRAYPAPKFCNMVSLSRTGGVGEINFLFLPIETIVNIVLRRLKNEDDRHTARRIAIVHCEEDMQIRWLMDLLGEVTQ